MIAAEVSKRYRAIPQGCWGNPLLPPGGGAIRPAGQFPRLRTPAARKNVHARLEGSKLATARKTRTSIRESALWQAYDRRRYAILFYTLLLTLFMIPLAATAGFPAVLIRLLLGACLLAAILPNTTVRTRRTILVAVLLFLLAQYVPPQPHLSIIPVLLEAVAAVTGLAAAAGTLRFTVKQRTVNPETIYAALSTYLLAGLFFGQIYWLIESIHPGSITGPDPVTEVTTVYYSFITLATLGYGDFIPRVDLVRGFATFEVIGGQLFLAVLVARLIGSFGPNEN